MVHFTDLHKQLEPIEIDMRLKQKKFDGVRLTKKVSESPLPDMDQAAQSRFFLPVPTKASILAFVL
jgi:hypothetical protein